MGVAVALWVYRSQAGQKSLLSSPPSVSVSPSLPHPAVSKCCAGLSAEEVLGEEGGPAGVWGRRAGNAVRCPGLWMGVHTVLGTHCPPCWQVLIPSIYSRSLGGPAFSSREGSSLESRGLEMGRVPGGGTNEDTGPMSLAEQSLVASAPFCSFLQLEMGGVLYPLIPDPPPGMLVTPYHPQSPYTHPGRGVVQGNSGASLSPEGRV